jgi:exopolysaccharide biosynthesis polyprenyl glycosylphosphotransferase
MKRENARVTGWLTLLVDFISMTFSFALAGFIRGGILDSTISGGIYTNAIIVLTFSIIIVSYIGTSNNNIFKRGYFEEFVSIIKDQSEIALIFFIYMFAIKESGEYSRIFLGLFFLFQVLFTFVLRSYMKLIMLLGYKKSSASNKVMLVTISKDAQNIIRKIRREYEWQIYVTTIALLDKDRIGDTIEGIQVVANYENLFEAVRLNVVDEVLICIPRSLSIDLKVLVLEFEKMGIIVHIHLDMLSTLNLKHKTINEFAGHQVITFSTILFDTKHAILKRTVDIIGGFVGCIMAIMLTIILAPVIWLESPGPIFFSQTRVGKNGRKFKIFKFRSMYKDAEERKKELMEKNEMQGLMFKMTDDPRITKIGKFIRKTSLDEFPQFFNVLMGDMSLVGTRPPTEDEFVLYEGRHKRRLMLKPGLTGLWQVSGRSDIDNFEDVVRMDLEYIDNWSMKLDLKLLVKTVGVVVFGRGAR